MADKVTVNSEVNGSVYLNEQSAAQTDVTGYGQLWVKNATPNELWFTDDAGTDVQLGSGGGSGFSSKIDVYLGTNQSIPSGTFTKVNLDTENYDTDSEFDSTTNYRFTATAAGYYSIKASIGYLSVNDNKMGQCWIYKNGSAYRRNVESWSNTTWGMTSIACDIYLAANDYIELYTWHDNGTAKNIAGDNGRTYMSIHRFA